MKWLVGIVCLLYPTTATAASPSNQKFAAANLESKSGSKVTGTVTFTQKTKGIAVVATVSGATPGKHGIHIHETGDCSALDAASAGGHLNPHQTPHAGPEASQRHLGDLGNITVAKNGKGTLKRDFTDPADVAEWKEIIGKSVVVHAKADDLKSQPAGDSGDRIACGTIQAIKEGNAT